MSSKTYWKEREAEQLRHYITDEKEYDKQLERIYNDMLYNIQKEIESFYGKYAKQEGVTITEAKKRVAKVDIEAYERKAKKYVEDAAKDRKKNNGKTNRKGYYFSDQANEEMRLYNLTMKVNRLEMLKANIGLELIKGHSELEEFMEDVLQGRTEEELKRQAGILGKTIKNNAKAAEAIVNASFYNATFSDRIWMHQDLLKSEISKLLQTGLIQGKNPRVLAKELKKKFDVKTSDAERLMRTELARVQTEAQKQSFIRNGFDTYEFICNHNGNTCDICRELNGKHFKVEKMMPGENAPPMHPNCVLPDTKIIAPDMEAMTKSEYLGDVIEIKTANGTRLTVTANHIMLTARGWVRAKNIVEGDKVIRYCGWAESMVEANPANNDCIPTIEELFTALIESSTMPPLCMPVAAEYFKGDVVPDSEVDIVLVDGKLRDKLDPTALKFVSDVPFVGAAVGSESELPSDCTLAKFLVGTGLASDGIMSGTDIACILRNGAFTHHELVSFRRPSDYYARLLKTKVDNRAANTELLCNCILTDSGIIQGNDFVGVDVDCNTFEGNAVSFKTAFNSGFSNTEGISDLLCAFPGIVAFDDVTFVTNKFYSGHVYDVSSQSTLYIANGILSSNCRCSTAPWEDSEEYGAWLDFLDKGGTTEEWNKQFVEGKMIAEKSGAYSRYIYENKKVFYDPSNDYSINLSGFSENVNKGLSKAIQSVAEKGSKDGCEHMHLVNLSNGKVEYYETNGVENSVGIDFWRHIDKYPDVNFAFVHNHNIVSSLSEADLTTPIIYQNIPLQIAVQNDGVKYIVLRTKDAVKKFYSDIYYEDVLEELNKLSRSGKITATERIRMREQIIIEQMLAEFYEEGMIVEDGRSKK